MNWNIKFKFRILWLSRLPYFWLPDPTTPFSPIIFLPLSSLQALGAFMCVYEDIPACVSKILQWKTKLPWRADEDFNR